MRRNVLALAGLALVGVVLTALVVAQGGDLGAGSAQSRGAGGWAAARLYVEGRGTPVELIDRPLAEWESKGRVLVLVLPWQRWELGNLRRDLTRHLQGGGDVVFAYSGERAQVTSEGRVADALGLTEITLRPRAPLRPLAWNAFAREEWTLAPPGDATDARAIRVRAFGHGYAAPAEAATLLADGQGRPLAFAFHRHRGRVFVLPAPVLANTGVGQAPGADLLESLRAALPGTWAFDEYHHGLTAAATAAAAGGRHVFDLWLLHLAVVYLLALAALARPFGPVWSDPPVRTGSAATFLHGLGALHKRLGHEREAAALLVARARELDPRVPEYDPGAATLLTLARTLAGDRAPRRTR